MMRLLVADTEDGRSMAYLIDRTSMVKCNGSEGENPNFVQLNFNNLRPISNSHGSLVVMSEAGWRKYAKAINAKFYKETSDLIFWSSTGLQS